MAWYGGEGRPHAKKRLEDCAFYVTIGAFRDWLLSSNADVPAVYMARWKDCRPYFVPHDAVPTWLAPRCPPDWQHRVQVDRSPDGRGRSRWVFRCSSCDRACRALYAPRVGFPFECRYCHELTYESAQAWDNLARKGRYPGLMGRIMDEIQEGGTGQDAVRRYRDRW